jgi:Ca2+-binding EF-hand superfamily protein
MAAPYDPQVQQWFAAVDSDHSGRISGTELQSALMSSNGRQFSETACRLMIGLFDHSGTGSIDITGFGQLYGYVNQWMDAFRRYDSNGSGFVDQNELMQAFTTMGYRFSQPFMEVLHTKFGEHGRGVPVDGFIMSCILIHKLTDGFRKRDTAQQGVITINYEDFLSTVLQAWA